MESAVDTMGDNQQKATIARLRQLLQERSSGQWHPPTLASSQYPVPGYLSMVNPCTVARGCSPAHALAAIAIVAGLGAACACSRSVQCLLALWFPLGAPTEDPGPVVPGPPELPVFQSKAGCLANVRCVKTGEVFMLFKDPFRFGTESEGTVLQRVARSAAAAGAGGPRRPCVGAVVRAATMPPARATCIAPHDDPLSPVAHGGGFVTAYLAR